MKSQYWQVVRGICILAVITIHCPSGIDGLDLYTWLGIRQLIDFPVALFIFMAGYFVKANKVNLEWIKNRGGRLLIPFIIWSFIYLGKNIIFSDISIKSLIITFITGKAAAPLYFILVLIQLTVLTPLLVRHRKTWMYLITPAYLIFLYVFNICTGRMPVLYETLFPAWFVFYILGMDARAGELERFRVKVWMIGLALAGSFAEAAVLMHLGCSAGFACSQIRFMPFIYTILIALWLSQHVKDIKPNVMSIAGDCSFGIYFCHIAFLMVVSKVLKIVGCDVWILKWVLTLVLTAASSFMFVDMVRKIFAGKKILRCIGFE